MKTMELSRRQFLKGTGALIVSFNLFPTASDLFAQSPSNLLPNGDLDPQALDSWLAVGADSTITVFTSKVEIGTGTVTALAQIVAEELDVSVNRIKMVSGDTTKSVEQGSTVGSRSIERAGPQFKQAAAAARQELLKLAAARLGATGDHVYAHDVRGPGMLHGRAVRPPVINTAPERIDEDSVKQIPGFVKVVREGSFVGVVAKTQWSAIKAAEALKVTWSKPTTKLPANPEELFAYLKNTKPVRTQKAVEKGNVATAFNDAKKTYQASYRWPFQMHGMIGPSCAVADVKGDKATIWSGPQGPFRARGTVATLLKIPEQNVRVIYHEASGSYGRMSTDDGAEDAALLSRAVGAPVRVQWSREDEHGWEPKGPAQLDEVKAAIDGDGKLIAWDFVDYGQPWTASGATPLLASLQVGFKPNNPGQSNGTQGGGEIYAVPNQKIIAEHIKWHFPETIPLRTSNLRAPRHPAPCFAS